MLGLSVRVALVTSALIPFSSASAQFSPPDPPWLAWQGCWQAEGAPAGEYLCIAPEGEGARFVTVAEGAVHAETFVTADGRARPIKQEGCTGSERASWSADEQRVFLVSELTCEGGITRKVSGIFALTAPLEWVSAQAVTIDGQTATRTTHYVAVEPISVPAGIAAALRGSHPAIAAARNLASAALDENDISEAVSAINPAAVQEWLDASGAPFQLAGQEVPTISALDQVGRAPAAQPTVTREVVHIREQPVYITRTYVRPVIRSCWDPFFGGYVGAGYGVSIGLGFGGGYCSRHYYSRYSPWGYDLYGWRHIHSPIIIVRGGPTIIRRPPRFDDHDRDRWRRGPVVVRQRDDDSRHGRVTRDGYSSSERTRSTAPPQSTRSTSSSPPSPRSGSITSRLDNLRSSSGTRSPTITRSAEPRPTRSSGTITRSPQPRSTPRATSGSQSRGSSKSTATPRTAKPRSSDR